MWRDRVARAALRVLHLGDPSPGPRPGPGPVYGEGFPRPSEVGAAPRGVWQLSCNAETPRRASGTARRNLDALCNGGGRVVLDEHVT